MNDEQRLHNLGNLAKWRKSKRIDRTVRLSSALGKILDSRLTRQHAAGGSVAEKWAALLPPELAARSRPVGLEAGKLKIKVDSAAYLYEMRLCKSELLSQLKRECPGAKIKDINFVIR